jgi:PAS domain S-box-containing protein
VKKRTFIALTITLTGVCALLFNIFYMEAKNTAITKLNEEQMIHAKQAALGIEDFFATWTRSLNSLSKMDAIIDTDAAGKHYMKFFYDAHREHLRTITRVDERGVILYNLPQLSSEGADISDQKHVVELLRGHKPVVSDVFRAIEGFDAVALYVPIFRGSEFKGGIGILVNFENIANHYLDVVKIGQTGHAWVVSRDGAQLYSPIAGSTGKSVFETIKDSPSLTVMVNDMVNGHEGASTYTFHRTGDRNVGQIREYAVYRPVQIANTFWSIAVASAEQDVLSGLISFRNKLAFVMGALFICWMVFSTLGAKAWLIVKEEEKRKRTERMLRKSEESLRIAEQQYRSIFENALEGIYQTSAKGQPFVGNPALARILGYDSRAEVVSPFTDSARHLWVDPNQRLDYIRLLEQNGVVLNYECEFYRKDKTRIWVSLNSRLVTVVDGETLNYTGFIQDISERKQAEEMLREHEKELMMLTGRLISTQEEELRRLSRELHDDLTQRLAVLAMDAGMIEKQLRPLKTPAAQETRDLKGKLIEVSEVVHDLSRQLHPSILDDLGLAQAVQSECAVFTRRTGITLSFKAHDVSDSIPNGIALCIYRVIQEGLRNIATHAKTNEARIILQGIDGSVDLLIQDLGIGFDVREVKEKPGIGLTGMRERVRLVGGTMSLRSQPGEGSEIQISIPLGGKHGQTARTDCR